MSHSLSNEYWGYKFVIEWEDFSEIAKIEAEQEQERMSRSGARRKWLSEIDEVRKLQITEEKERKEMHERVLALQKKHAGLIVINGVETTMPSSKTTPRFIDGLQNSLVAPVRKQDLRLFPSYGFRDQNEQVLSEGLEREQMLLMTKMKEDKNVGVDEMISKFSGGINVRTGGSGSVSGSGGVKSGAAGGRRGSFALADNYDIGAKISNSRNEIISSKVLKVNIHDKTRDERSREFGRL